jgi:hypothetical protein
MIAAIADVIIWQQMTADLAGISSTVVLDEVGMKK